MTVSAVQSPVAPVAQQPGEAPGIAERLVRAVAQAIFSVFRSLFVYLGWIKEAPLAAIPPAPPGKPSEEENVYKPLLDQLKAHTLCPDVLYEQFERHVPLAERQEALEALGRKVELSWPDWVFFKTQRSDEVVAAKYRDLGKAVALKNPYQLAGALEAALQKKI